MATGALASLLVLADGRFPSGGHAHSGGLEAAVAAGRVRTLDDLAAFLRGRLSTSGLVAAALAAATWFRSEDPTGDSWLALDAEADARTPSPALRHASRRQGRQLLRAARTAWPSQLLDSLHEALPAGPHHPVSLGGAARAAGLSATAAATAAASSSVSGPATAAVRLLSLDPLAVTAVLARLAPDVDDVARQGVAVGARPLRDLPALSAPLLDIGAEAHGTWEVRLFAS